jgi:ATP-binding protein involved in chromosome partitioning
MEIWDRLIVAKAFRSIKIKKEFARRVMLRSGQLDAVSYRLLMPLSSVDIIDPIGQYFVSERKIVESVTEERVIDALRKVEDPELHRDIVSLGMVKNLAVAQGNVRFTVELTTPACPLRETIENDCRKALSGIAGVGSLEINFGAQVRGSKAGAGQTDLLPTVKNVVLVAAGKGGVGKSTVAANLAVALKMHGAATGLLDADIYGPSVPMIMGVKGEPNKIEIDGAHKIQPALAHGVPVMSIGFFLDPDQAVIWRGPMLGKALHQLMADVHWGELDYLVVDMPPGTGDVQITFSQQLKVSGALLVATPQNVALADVVRAKSMFDKVNIPILGIVENMSYFVCDGCGKKHEIFSRGGARRAAERFNIPYLGEIPITPALREGGDNGVPSLVQDPRSEVSKCFLEIAAKLAGQLSIASEQAKKTQSLKIVSS